MDVEEGFTDMASGSTVASVKLKFPGILLVILLSTALKS